MTLYELYEGGITVLYNYTVINNVHASIEHFERLPYEFSNENTKIYNARYAIYSLHLYTHTHHCYNLRRTLIVSTHIHGESETAVTNTWREHENLMILLIKCMQDRN